ncbi:MAG: hypothetical protein A2Z37_15210 [Chloroflexi bacterium RBG_19FT_COMBO_62_14]|nr:MAG: hypothetical protein A2Z37_15210 [Chloroflexi bacterium RBG_19FT_COMBO_62_14]
MAVRRPTTRLSMASCSNSTSEVGAWINSAVRAKATIPICVLDRWRWMKDRAEALAASSRFGGMSVEHMLLETSSARMMVACPPGTLTTVTGRAAATIRDASALRKRANGRWRRQRDDGGRA